MRRNSWIAIVALLIGLSPVVAADYPAPVSRDWTIRDFHFKSGEVLPELRLHYTTVGAPTGIPVLILHGSAGSGTDMLSPVFAGELFGPGQPLDAGKYFVILPDAIGAGGSSKPSEGLRAKFPRYVYDDMVEAQYRLVTEGLGIRHLRLVMGNSMGGMHTWLWGVEHPDFVDTLVPMASQPTAMASRNWMLRRLMIEMIRSDPEWNDGNYVSQPRSLRLATTFYGTATNGGSTAFQELAPTHEAAERYVNQRLTAPSTLDANDYIYQYDASRDFDPSAKIGSIRATVLAINSADDERNPPETGVMARAIAHIRHAKLYLIPESKETRGHGTTGMARFYKKQLSELLRAAPVVGVTH